MNFRTNIEKINLSFNIEYSDKLFFIGSCFANNIWNKCYWSWAIDSYSNPYGVTYNPSSVIQVLKSVEKKVLPEDNLFIESSTEKWCSMMHHSDFDRNTKEELIEEISRNNNQAYDFLCSSNVVFITLGTAWVYELVDSGVVVNNCHKLPSSAFNRRRLSVNEIVNDFIELFSSSEILKSKRIVFTVSPIRHLRDGLAENMLSKATLITAIHELVERFDNVYYFPAFEIMMDDLRDYRFYADDMTHPSSIAVDYIAECFANCLFSKSTHEYIKMVKKVTDGYAHRPINENSEAHKRFKSSMLKHIDTILKKYPDANVNRFVKYFLQ